MSHHFSVPLAVLISALAACSASSAPDRCITVDAGEALHVHTPKYEVCLPDKATHGAIGSNTNKLNVVNGYDGTWMTSGVYELSIIRDERMFPSTQESPEAKESRENWLRLGMREIKIGERSLFYRLNNKIYDKLPEEAKKQSVGMAVIEERNDSIVVSIHAAVKKPKDFETDPVGSMDRLIKKDVTELLRRIKITSAPSTSKP